MNGGKKNAGKSFKKKLSKEKMFATED